MGEENTPVEPVEVHTPQDQTSIPVEETPPVESVPEDVPPVQ